MPTQSKQTGSVIEGNKRRFKKNVTQWKPCKWYEYYMQVKRRIIKRKYNQL